MKPECYISVDIESAGPIPGKYSMLSLGACVVDSIDQTFYVELQPISNESVPEALAVSGLNLSQLASDGRPPKEAMTEFKKWIAVVSKGHHVVFVGFNGCYDWQFINWYFESYCGENPFGFGGIDIKSFFMGLKGVAWDATRSSQLPPEFQPDVPQTHNALADARAQASMFSKMMRDAQARRP